MIRTYAKPGSRRRDGRDLVWGLAALAFACALLGRPHPAEAGDCSAKTDCRYVPDNGNAVLPVAAGATGVAVGTGLRRRRRRGPATEPVYKPPKEYTDPATGGARDNPWDPPIDEQRDRWNKDHLVWDPGTLSWRPPKPGEVPPPPNAPESTPFQRTNPRDGTPPECLGVYDDYVQAQADVMQLEQDLQDAANHLQKAQLYLNQNLVKLTLQLQMDTADIFMAGSSGVKAGMGIATAVAAAPGAIAELIRATMTKAKYLEEVVARLIESAGQLAARLARIESSVSTFSASTEPLAAEASQAGDAVEAAEARVSRAQQRVNLSSQVDELTAQRDSVVQEATDAENKLGIGEKYWERKQALNEWANSERAAAAEDNNRAFAGAHGELEDAKAQLEGLRVTNPDEIQAAGEATQAKLDEVRQAKRNVDSLNQARKELHSAQQVRDEAETVLKSLDDEIAKIEPDALEYKNKIEELRKKETAAEADLRTAKNKLAKANADRDALHAELESAAERGESLASDPAFKAKLDAADAARKEASAGVTAAEQVHGQAYYEWKRYFGDGIEGAPKSPFDNPLAETHKRYGELQTKRSAAERDFKYAQDGVDRLQQQVDGIPSDQLAGADQEYLRLTREYDDLRAREQKLKDGGFRDDGKASELRTKIQQLEQRLRNWKDPDWEDYAAQHDAGKYQQWKLEVAGTDPAADQAHDLAGARQQVADLKRREDQLEKQIADLRDQIQPDVTMDSPQTALANAEQDLAEKQQAAVTKKQAADQAEQQMRAAQTELASVRAERDAKQQQLEQAQTDLSAAHAEVDRLQSQQNAGGGDMMQAPQGVVQGVQQAVGDAAAAASAAKQYIVDKLRSAVGKVGKAWEWAFNGQSPDEIAQILKSQHDAVQHWVDELNQKHQAVDDARAALRDLKPQLDACVAAHHDTA